MIKLTSIHIDAPSGKWFNAGDLFAQLAEMERGKCYPAGVTVITLRTCTIRVTVEGTHRFISADATFNHFGNSLGSRTLEGGCQLSMGGLVRSGDGSIMCRSPAGDDRMLYYAPGKRQRRSG